ncbi:LysR substrate-binding domain-containing protein [Hafnia alvei]|uniref:LysR substrate-binding domain-containing protein n=1 Tax=Hafnia alvei TaxID=569 RepID=UPI0015F145EF|nr:LysR substrate-binding domain-containing protein [Hafnia alvei]
MHKEKVTLTVAPRLITNNMRAVVYAAINGVGITCLPRFICLDHIDSGALVHVLPEWTNEPHSIHALYESKRGQTLLFKTFLDYLSQSLNEVRRINKT